MSIYPVSVKKWFPPTDKSEENKRMRDHIKMFLSFMKCTECGGRLKMRNSWVYHSMPFGSHTDRAWCSAHCMGAKS